ncbi:MAG TPA: elongation factor G [Candidatus Avoscillospira stercoripullorum]|uniref:Elongation factor G n=1 Tax=Candidatus Avoscillospira stercoripullorum TaxID=2840709 RepID=A0A9D1A8G9_9FIRM|nr:elongation factor G [Candidatus Avoscillospira stercoripullorum]
MSYTAKDIRNICLLGHGGDGKTILAEDMLFLTNGSDRLGSIADGNTVSDFDPEEIKRKYSISTSIIPVNFEGCKINLLDNPGFFDFAGEIVQSLRVADAGLIVLSAKGGIAVGTEKAWKSLKNANMPTMFYISKMDEDHANYYKVVDDMRAAFGNTVVPLIFPMMKGDKCVGLVDLLSRTARDTEGNSTALTPEAEARCEEYLAELSEQVAETSEELMEKFFMEEPFTEEELIQGVKDGMRQRSITPVFCGSALAGYGSKRVMEYIVKFCPNPLEGLPMATAEGGELMLDPKGSPAVFVFKTTSDQFGKNSYFKVISGDITEGMSLVNARTGGAEKLSNIFFAKGKTLTKAAKICCGDLGVATKLGSVKTGDTLGLAGKVTALQGMTYDEPCYTMAIYAKVKGQEDKIASGLNKLNEEDLSFRFGNNAETKEMIISGVGDIHLGVLCSKLLSKFKVEAELRPAKIAYRETIKKKVEVHGRHKKQSGGHGQFGDVYIRFEPQTETEDLVFVDETVGGCVPKNFIPSVEKGLRNCIGKGVLAGYPLVFLKATLYFGSYHPVDSSDMAFQTAAAVAYKDGIPTAAPTLLEPIGELKVYIPDANLGDIIGDLNKRRGRVMGMTPTGDGQQVVDAEVPMGEMSSYAIDLRSMTQGRGSYSLKFVRYEEVPQMNQAKIIEEAKKAEEG